MYKYMKIKRDIIIEIVEKVQETSSDTGIIIYITEPLLYMLHEQ